MAEPGGLHSEIASHDLNHIWVRGIDLTADLMGIRSFSDVTFLLIKSCFPTENEKRFARCDFGLAEEGSLFAKQEFEFIRPVMVGKAYKLTGKLQGSYKKRGRTYFEMGVSVTDSSGAEVLKMVKTIAAPVKPVADEETTT
jgi:hypothetical protein